MNAVELIIRRHLAASREITIPTLGTLTVERESAQIVDSGTRLSVPLKKITIADRESTSIIDYIIHDTHTDEVQATLLYNEWLDAANDSTRITIEGVGVIDLETTTFQPCEEFDAILNPTPSEKIVIKRGGTKPVAELKPVPGQNNFLMVLAIIAAIISVAYLLYYFADYFKAIGK